MYVWPFKRNVGVTYASFAGLCILATSLVGIFKYAQIHFNWTYFDNRRRNNLNIFGANS